jgi:AmmeMemoRadiSam system protein B
MRFSGIIVGLLLGVVIMGTSSCRAEQGAKDSGAKVAIRPMAVAGQFYPSNADHLRADIEEYLAATKDARLPAHPRMLISPHAGYVFSGPVAAYGYAALDKNISTVIVIGPSHHEYFSGVSISSADYYATPLGTVALNKALIATLRKNRIVTENLDADLPEHSIEVELPFLQVVLPSFTIVPIITGEVDPTVLAEMLLPLIDDKTLVVASSDLSHYHPSDDAKAIDARTIATVMSGDYRGFLDACGERPIRVMMVLAKKLGLSPVELNRRNSYETAPQYGGPERVVGYASVAYVKKP